MSSTITETRNDTAQPVNGQKDLSKYDFANLEPYVHPPETKSDLPWSELVTLDLEDYGRPGGKERLSKQLEHAVHHVGFFYVKNYGLTQEEVDRQFTLAKAFFELPESEKEPYEINYKIADYNGWRRRGQKAYDGKTRDNIEIFNFAKATKDFEGKLLFGPPPITTRYTNTRCVGVSEGKRPHMYISLHTHTVVVSTSNSYCSLHHKYGFPDLLRAHLPEIHRFHRALHTNVVLPLLRLFAIILELPDEEYLVRQHTYEEKSEDHFRYMLYHPRTEQEWADSKYGATGGHTDLGTVTLLFRQPVAGLQILGEDGEWTWVAAQPGTITVNLAELNVECQVVLRLLLFVAEWQFPLRP